MKEVFDLLESLGIKYESYEHPAVFTVEEAKKYRPHSDFGEVKNLFLRNKKGDKHYLVVIDSSKQLDTNKLSEKIGEKISAFLAQKDC